MPGRRRSSAGTSALNLNPAVGQGEVTIKVKVKFREKSLWIITIN
jgi:hypothetical protein